jgi:cytochrome c2
MVPGGVSRGSRRPWSLLLVAGLVAAVVASACASSPPSTPPPQVADGNPALGVEAIQRYGCGSCHVIPGVAGADGKVGPPLNDFSERGFIAGQLENNGENLITWIEDPQGVEPGTAMPNLGVTAQDARDIAAYLFTLR